MPYEKILELVEAKHLDISLVNLAKITNEFVKYIECLEGRARPDILAEFVAVASKLLLIKSRMLLPNLVLTQEEEQETKDLESRLLLHQQIKPACETIKNLWNKKQSGFSRPLFANINRVFYPPSTISITTIRDSLVKLAVEIQQLIPENQQIKKEIISLESKIEQLTNRLKESPQQNLNTLLQNQSRAEIIATFLAILFLFKRRAIGVAQKGHFDDIIINYEG